jgi:Ribbon-helix-helix protein, copG family
MPSKLKPTAVRISPEMVARIDKHAQRNGTSRHRAILDLLAEGLAVIEAWGKTARAPASRKPAPRAILAQAEKQAAHLAKPKLPNVHSGPVRAKPGSRLKAK